MLADCSTGGGCATREVTEAFGHLKPRLLLTGSLALHTGATTAAAIFSRCYRVATTAAHDFAFERFVIVDETHEGSPIYQFNLSQLILCLQSGGKSSSYLQDFESLGNQAQLAVAVAHAALECDAGVLLKQVLVCRKIFGEDDRLYGAAVVGDFYKRHLVAASG